MVKTSLLCVTLMLLVAVAFGEKDEEEKSVKKTEFTKEDCSKDATKSSTGCMAAVKVFTWNNKDKKCEEVIYGGCNASANNFKTKEDCEKIAKPICEKE